MSTQADETMQFEVRPSGIAVARLMVDADTGAVAATDDTEPDAMWEIDQDESDDRNLNVHDGEGWHSARVRQDGCVDYYRYHNEPFGGGDMGMTDYLHICDIDAEIDLLRQLKALARRHFGTDELHTCDIDAETGLLRRLKVLAQRHFGTDYLHACDVDAETERLQHLKALAKRHFGEDWR